MKHSDTNASEKLITAWPFVLLLTLASMLSAGCSHPPRPVDRDLCLDAGPAKSAAYESCAVDREERKAAALSAVLGDRPAYDRPLQLAEPDENSFQLSDFPDSPNPAIYSIAQSISASEKQAQPFKVRVTWKHASTTAMLAPRDRARMAKMEGLILSAVTDSGSAKWVCTVTGVHQREWIFYARSDDAFITRVQATLAPTGPYPIEFSSRKEPAWNADGLNGEKLSEQIRITPKQCVE
ncbi:DUF695 domain-containing protein [Pseudomonas shahriarae]|uniref:DUF695 domain-containing protein n=1 Tax=Pseudomonas shahriarae TaxID=2745512 RepID=A0A9X4BYF0_9PSED|nr:DUF695 domain-containing protein [Pseudomonas shahriarae]MDD1006910.1 DUF695 domain-containing protein [Pseudomonas shahriarae]